VVFREINVSDWLVLAQEEVGGSEPHIWLTAPNPVASESREQWWLYKPVKTGARPVAGGGGGTYSRHDDEAERVACALARLIGLPAAEVEIAVRNEDRGVISRNVTPDGWALYGGDLILSVVEGYVSCQGENRPRNRQGHNLTNVSQVLAGHPGPAEYGSWQAFEVFAGYLVFDAWIANTDRHAMNWAVLERGGERILAPSFDHGSALASGSSDDDLSRKDPMTFSRGGMARSFEGGRSITLVEIALEAVQRAGGRATEWLHRLAEVQDDAIDRVLNDVPAMSDRRCTFLATVLSENRRRLTT
jgi:hypothetical protein